MFQKDYAIGPVVIFLAWIPLQCNKIVKDRIRYFVTYLKFYIFDLFFVCHNDLKQLSTIFPNTIFDNIAVHQLNITNWIFKFKYCSTATKRRVSRLQRLVPHRPEPHRPVVQPPQLLGPTNPSQQPGTDLKKGDNDNFFKLFIIYFSPHIASNVTCS